MDPITQSITCTRAFPTPTGYFDHWQAVPLRLALSLATGATLTGALTVVAEIHDSQTSDPSSLLANVEHTITDFDGPFTIDFTGAQLNQDIPDTKVWTELWLVIVATYADDRVDTLAVRSIKLHRSNYSGSTATPPDPVTSYLTAAQTTALYDALDARVTDLETNGTGGPGGGLITIVSDTGTATAYDPASDTDAARGTALLAAVAAATAGQTIRMEAGTYAIGNGRVLLPDDVHLDMDPGTVITGTTNLSTVGTMVKPGNRSRIRGGKILGTAASGISQGPFGLTNVQADTPAIDWVVENTIMEADSDALYILSDEVCTGILINVTLISKYDIIYVSGNNGAPAAHDVKLYTPRGVVAGLSTIANPQGRGTTIAYGATVRIFGGSLDINDGGTILNAGVAVYVDGVLYLHNVAINTSNGTDPNYDLYTNSTGQIYVTGGSGSGTDGLYVTNAGNVSYLWGPPSAGSGPILVSGSVAYFTYADTLYSFPVYAGASGAGADTDITVSGSVATFVYNDVTYTFPVA